MLIYCAHFKVFIVLGMQETRFYDEAVHKFLGEKPLTPYPVNSLEFYVPHFNKVCKSLNDVRGLKELADQGNWQGEIPFQNEILDKNHVIVVTDEHLKIVFATENIRFMNGYSPEEVIGNSPKMFQGEGTCKKTTQKVSSAIKAQSPFEVVLTNYKKDGSQYNCWIKATPIFNKRGKVVNFIAFEKAVA